MVAWPMEMICSISCASFHKEGFKPKHRNQQYLQYLFTCLKLARFLKNDSANQTYFRTASTIGSGAVLLKELNRPQTVTSLWEKVRTHHIVGNFERFVLALDLLHIMGSVVQINGMIEKVEA